MRSFNFEKKKKTRTTGSNGTEIDGGGQANLVYVMISFDVLARQLSFACPVTKTPSACGAAMRNDVPLFESRKREEN
jgi:hypothetical protein